MHSPTVGRIVESARRGSVGLTSGRQLEFGLGDVAWRGAGLQYHQKVNNELGLYPVGNRLSKRK